MKSWLLAKKGNDGGSFTSKVIKITSGAALEESDSNSSIDYDDIEDLLES